MRVLYVAPIRDRTGWGRAAVDYALALDAAGVDVVARCFRYSPGVAPLPPRLLELEARPDKGCEAVIQVALPTDYDYDGRFAKNVGVYFVEADDFSSSDWPRRINAMDEAWVPCRHNREASLASGVDVPVRVAGCPSDVSKFARDYRPHEIRRELGDAFVFYTIGEHIARKDLASLAVAFHLEFDPAEPVELVIKTSVPGVTPAEARERVRSDLAVLKRELNLYPDPAHYKEEVVLAERMDEESLNRLHHSCDCYVGPGHGEGWGIPAFDALGFGRTPIVGRHSAHLDYVTDETGWLVDGTSTPVIGMRSVHEELYTARQSWFSIDVASLRRAMREACEDRDLREEKSLAGAEKACEFSHAAVGRRMRGFLES